MVDGNEYWCISLHVLGEEIWDAQELMNINDAKGVHYIGVCGTRDEARAKITDAFMRLIDRLIVRVSHD